MSEKKDLVLAIDTRTNIRKFNNANTDKEMTAQTLAKVAGCSSQNISDWAQSRENPKVPSVVYKLYRISKALGCSIDDLIIEKNG